MIGCPLPTLHLIHESYDNNDHLQYDMIWFDVYRIVLLYSAIAVRCAVFVGLQAAVVYRATCQHASSPAAATTDSGHCRLLREMPDGCDGSCHYCRHCATSSHWRQPATTRIVCCRWWTRATRCLTSVKRVVLYTEVDAQCDKLALLAKVVSRPSTVVSIVNLVRLTTVGSLSHWASIWIELSWQHVAIDTRRAMAKFYKSRVLTKNAEVSTLVLDIPEFSHKHCRVDRQNQLDPFRQNSSNSTDTETGNS